MFLLAGCFWLLNFQVRKVYIGAYVDVNNDGEYQASEDANYYSVETGQPAPVVLKPGQTVEVPDIVISGKLPTLSGNESHRAEIHKFV